MAYLKKWFLALFEIKNQKQIQIFRGFLIFHLHNISFPKSFLNALAIFLTIFQSQSKHSRLKLQKNLKKTLWSLLMDGVQLSRGYRATTRRQFTFYHQVTRSTWYSFYPSQKDERLSQPWSYSVVLNLKPLDWESSTLTTRPLL